MRVGAEHATLGYMSPPVVVEISRGSFLESRHEVDVAIVGADGHRSGFGNPTRPTLARSALKPIQAFPLVKSGPLAKGSAADAFSMSVQELAMACASHGGEPMHIEVVSAWLERLGLDVHALECAGHPPSHAASAEALVAAGTGFDARHNNCSGKHTGFLTVCRHHDLDPAGYLAPGHPLQRDHITPAIEELCSISTADQDPGVDGCGIPVWEIPLDRLARGWANLAADPAGLRLYEAMMAAPELVAGTGRMCTRVMQAGRGEVAVKTGAEGVFCAVVPRAGFAVAIKCRDGATRAAEATLLWVLADLGVRIDVEMNPLTNAAGVEVGSVRVRA